LLKVIFGYQALHLQEAKRIGPVVYANTRIRFAELFAGTKVPWHYVPVSGAFFTPGSKNRLKKESATVQKAIAYAPRNLNFRWQGAVARRWPNPQARHLLCVPADGANPPFEMPLQFQSHQALPS
jgi:hypothetical protein